MSKISKESYQGKYVSTKIVKIIKEKRASALILVDYSGKMGEYHFEELKEDNSNFFDIVALLKSRGGGWVGVISCKEDRTKEDLISRLEKIKEKINNHNNEYIVWEWEGEIMIGDTFGILMYTSEWNKSCALDINLDNIAVDIIVETVENS